MKSLLKEFGVDNKELDKILPDEFRLKADSGMPTIYPKDTTVVVTDPFSDNYGSVGVVTGTSKQDSLLMVKTAYDVIAIRPENVTPIEVKTKEKEGDRLETIEASKRIKKIANRLSKTGGVKSEDELIQCGFEPTRKGLSESTVAKNIEMFGNQSDEGLVEAAKRNKDMVYAVGGDIPAGTAPYIFKYDGKKFQDNIKK